MTLIVANNIEKRFVMGSETVFALRDVSVKINAGEFVSITGPSGSGKSTLLYILGLLDRPSAGRYQFDGVDTTELSDDQAAALRNQRIGFIFQGFHLLPRATALRNVAMPLVYRANHTPPSLSEREIIARATRALEAVGLADRLHHLPRELSGGQRQRVAIARALVNEPRVLFADEPTGNLDSKSGASVVALMQRLHQQGTTILLVTHDQSLAATASRQIKLRDGRVEADVIS